MFSTPVIISESDKNKFILSMLSFGGAQPLQMAYLSPLAFGKAKFAYLYRCRKVARLHERFVLFKNLDAVMNCLQKIPLYSDNPSHFAIYSVERSEDGTAYLSLQKQLGSKF